MVVHIISFRLSPDFPPWRIRALLLTRELNIIFKYLPLDFPLFLKNLRGKKRNRKINPFKLHAIMIIIRDSYVNRNFIRMRELIQKRATNSQRPSLLRADPFTPTTCMVLLPYPVGACPPRSWQLSHTTTVNQSNNSLVATLDTTTFVFSKASFC